MLKPLTVQTDLSSSLHAQPPSKDYSFMMYPVGTDKTKTPIDVYGPEHFLRLFGKTTHSGFNFSMILSEVKQR